MAIRYRPLRKPVAKMALSTCAAGAMLIGGTGIAQACDNGSQTSGTSEAGTVQSVSGNVISILDRSGNTDMVDTNGNTVFETENGSTGSESGIANGDFLWAVGSMQPDGSLLATKVKYGPANQSNTRESDTNQSSQSQSGQSSAQAQPSSESQQSASSNSSGDDSDSGGSTSNSARHHHHHRS